MEMIKFDEKTPPNAATSADAPKNKIILALVIGIIALIIIIGAISYAAYLSISKSSLAQTAKNAAKIEDSSLKNIGSEISTEKWIRPTSTEQIIPVWEENEYPAKLYLYSLNRKKLITTNYEVSPTGGSLYHGSKDPVASPDGKYVAFINSNDNDSLYIIAGGTLEIRKITTIPVEYITTWSMDSSKLVYHHRSAVGDDGGLDDLSSRYGYGDRRIEKFEKDATPGFYLFDLATGTNTSLWPLKEVDKFIDSNRLLCPIDIEIGTDKNVSKIVLFDVNKFEADYSTLGNIINDDSLGQFSFSQDGKYWAFSDFTNGSKIILAEFPSKKGTVVDETTEEGSSVQTPLLSPGGQYLSYEKNVRANEVAGGVSHIIIWDISSSKPIKELEGSQYRWLGDSTLLTSDNETYNIITDTLEKIPEVPPSDETENTNQNTDQQDSSSSTVDQNNNCFNLDNLDFKAISKTNNDEEEAYGIYDGYAKVAGWYTKEIYDLWSMKLAYYYDKNGRKIVINQENCPMYLVLEDAPQELVSKLMAASEQEPLEIEIRGLQTSPEGLGASIAPAREAYKDQF